MSRKSQAQEGGSVLLAYRIAARLLTGPVTSPALVHDLWLTENTVNRHLNAAAKAGLVEKRTDTWPYTYTLK